MNTESPDMVNGSGVSVGGQPDVPKRRRGRPRKLIRTVTELSTEAAIEDEEVQSVLEYAKNDRNFVVNSHNSNIEHEDVETWYRRHSLCHSLLSNEKTLELIRIFQTGDAKASARAMEKLITHNQRLVASVANRYRGRLPFMDLVQEGNIGLQKSIERFDYVRYNILSTFAIWWIRRSITLAIGRMGFPLKVSDHALTDLAKIWNLTNELHASLERYPTEDEILDGAQKFMSKKTALALLRVSQPPVYIDMVSPESSSSGALTGHNKISDEFAISSDSLVMAKSDLELAETQVNAIVTAIKALADSGIISRAWESVFYSCYGLCGRVYGDTYEEIGKAHDMTRENVRLIANNNVWVCLYRHTPESYKLPRKKDFEMTLRSVPDLVSMTGIQVDFFQYQDNGGKFPPIGIKYGKRRGKKIKP